MKLGVSIKNANRLIQVYRTASHQIEQGLSQRVETALRITQRNVMKESPVDTGKLRQSIRFRKVSQLVGVVEPEVEYAMYVHEGTRFMRGNPFMDRALDKSQPRIVEELGRGLATQVRKMKV